MKVVWSRTAELSYYNILEYLKEEWSLKSAVNFINKVDNAIKQIKFNNKIGEALIWKKKYRKYIITKQVYLIYSICKKNRELKIHYFWNNYKNPERLKKLLS